MPIRIQRKRVMGWKMPDNTVYVGRPTKWGNPYVVGRDGTAEQCVAYYRNLLMASRGTVSVDRARLELRGKDLACFCQPGHPCHADVLLEIANS